MANSLPTDEPSLQSDQVSLTKSVKEILGIICCFHLSNKDNNAKASYTDQKLDLSIHIKKKSHEAKGDLDVFTIKVKCNRDVPIISSIKGFRASKLIEFVGQMQKHEEESHFAVRAPDVNDPSFTRTCVLWISTQEDNTTIVQIQDETLSKRAAHANDILVLQLRVFMNTSVLMGEVESMSSLLFSLKLLNPTVGVCLSLEGVCGVELDLSKCEYFLCESLMVSTDPKLYNRKSSFDDGVYEGDMSILKTFHACVDDTSRSSSLKITCGLIFLPRFIRNISQCEKRTSAEKRGEIYIQVYNSSGLPIDMLEFCLHFQITPDALLPLDDFKSVMKMIGTSSIAPYSMGCYVEMMQDANLPQFIKECDKFTIWLCFVLDQDLSYSDSMTNGILGCLKESANKTFQQLYQRETHKNSDNQTSSTAVCDYEDGVKKWITDISSALSNIYIKSTDLSFRARVAQMAPVHTCMSMKSYLQDALETILLTERGKSNRIEPLNTDRGEFKFIDEDWKEFPLSQLSLHEDPPEGSMSPDSLDLEVTEWHDIRSDSMDNAIEHQDENISIPVTRPQSFPLSQQMESSIQDGTTGQSFHGLFNNSSLENIPHNERVCANITQHDRTIQTQTTNICFKGLIQHSLPQIYSHAPNKERTLDLETELAQWKASGDLNQSANDRDSVNFTTDKNKGDLASWESQHQNNSSRCSDDYEISLIKRSNGKTAISSSKKMKVDVDLLSDGNFNYSQSNGVRNHFNSSSPTLMEIKASGLEYKPQRQDAYDKDTPPPALMMSSRRCADTSIEPANDFTHNEEVSDDWFSKDDFDNWCAELQD